MRNTAAENGDKERNRAKEARMSRQEFLDTLGRALKREMSDREVMDNIQYYDNYIEQEVRKGKSESEVLAVLGDPRLIAKTILQVEEQREEQTYGGAESVYTDAPGGGYAEERYSDEVKDEKDSFGKHVKVHNISKIQFWIILIAILIVLFAIVKTAFVIAWKLLPVLLVIAIVIWVYQKITQK